MTDYVYVHVVCRLELLPMLPKHVRACPCKSKVPISFASTVRTLQLKVTAKKEVTLLAPGGLPNALTQCPYKRANTVCPQEFQENISKANCKDLVQSVSMTFLHATNKSYRATAEAITSLSSGMQVIGFRDLSERGAHTFVEMMLDLGLVEGLGSHVRGKGAGVVDKPKTI